MDNFVNLYIDFEEREEKLSKIRSLIYDEKGNSKIHDPQLDHQFNKLDNEFCDLQDTLSDIINSEFLTKILSFRLIPDLSFSDDDWIATVLERKYKPQIWRWPTTKCVNILNTNLVVPTECNIAYLKGNKPYTVQQGTVITKIRYGKDWRKNAEGLYKYRNLLKFYTDKNFKFYIRTIDLVKWNCRPIKAVEYISII